MYFDKIDQNLCEMKLLKYYFCNIVFLITHLQSHIEKKYKKIIMLENTDITFCEIKYNSEEYQNELKLRDKVLRKPLGISLFNENLEGDKNDIHIAAFIKDELVGILLLKPMSNFELKMRQVAILEKYQSKKIGSNLVLFAEELAKNSGYKKVSLHARRTAVEFYQKLGYLKFEDEFFEVGIPHYKMLKELI